MQPWFKANCSFTDVIPILQRQGGFGLLLTISMLASSSFFSNHVSANTNDVELPTGAKIINGNINIASNQNQLKIIQSTQQGIINWNSFNIGKNAAVVFQQPNASSSILNRVISAIPSSISGSLTSNGQVFLLNPSGVYFGAGARVNVGSLIASTQSMSNEDFLSQNFLFNQTDLNGEIINAGSIIGDQVAMVSPRVTNLGDITAKSGDVVIASGDKVKLAITQNQSIAVELDASQVANLIDNQGTINAQGNIIFKADAMQSIVDQTIKLPQSANMMVSDNGTVRLVTNTGSVKATNVAMDAGALGGTYNNGVIDVSQENFQGGSISLTGQEVKVASLSKLNASGSTGGGSILIGGDWQGQGMTRQATYTSIDSGTYLDASAVQFGDGGKIVAWSDISNPLSHTAVHGNLTATAGTFGGNGGQIETSGYHLSIDDLAINVSANSGVTGEWLIDPVDFTVAASGGDMTGSLLTSNLGSANVTILSSSGSSGSDGNITINDAVTWSANKLTLNAYNNIYINADLLGSGTAQLDLLYGQGAVASGNTSDYSILKTSSADSTQFLAQVTLADGNNFSTTLGSDGSPINYQVISDLNSLMNNASGNYALGANVDASGVTTAASLDYCGGLRCKTLRFTGNIDGLGHTIDSFTSNVSNTYSAGLFPNIEDDLTFRNIGLTNRSTTSGIHSLGGFVGRIYSGTLNIINSYSSGTISGPGSGGFVGKVEGSSTTLIIKNSVNHINISSNGGNRTDGAGGFVGSNTGNLSIINSFNLGDITGYDSVGGLVGYSNSAFLEIDTSYNAGDIRNTRTSNSSVGGLVAEVLGSNANIYDSYNTGAISSARTGNQTSSTDGTGGIVGYFNAGTSSKIQYAYNAGSVTDGRINIGGIVGVLWNSTVDQVYNTGAISGPQDVGGIVGFNTSNGYVTNAYNTGQIGVSGVSASHIGGVVGRNDAYVQYAYGTGMVYGGGWKGSVVGRQVAGYANDLFGDYELTGIASFSGTSSQVTNANDFTTAQMKDLSNFTNFSGSLWSRFDSVNDGYPILLNNSPVSIVTFTANSLTKTYGESIDLSSFISNGWYSISGGTLASTFSVYPSFNLYSSGSLISDSTPDAGSYTITPSGGTLNSGFLVSYINGALTINQKALSVDAITYSNKTYDGDVVADVTLSVSGTVGDETLSYTPTATFASRNVGTQTVTVDSIAITNGTGNANNYSSIAAGHTGTATISQLNSVAWTGSGGNSFWSNAANWAGSAIPDASNVGIVNIGSGDTVTFNADSVGSMNSVINNSGALTLNTDSSYTLSSQISGIGSINKEGSGTFTLSSVENNYSGDTTISAGTLQITGLLGQGNYAADINNASSLKLNTSATQTLSGNLSGAGDLIKVGSNSLIITQANSGFSGNVAIDNGLIQTRNNAALGGAGRITIAAGAALDIQGYSLSNPFTIAGTGIANSGAIYNSATSGLSQLSGNITLDQTASINSDSDIIFGGSILGQAGENNSLTISAAEKTVTLNGLIGADPYTYTGTSGANPYALLVTAGTIKINNNITTNQNQTYFGDVVIGGNQTGSSGMERILLSLNPSITMNGSIDDETGNTHTLTLRSITQLGYSDVPSISLNASVGATKPLNDLNLIAMYDPAPEGYYGKIPSTPDTSPYYTGIIDIQSNVNVSDEVILVGRTVDLNDAVLTASNIEFYGYAAIAGGSIDLGTGSIFGSSNFADINVVNDAEYFAVEIAAADAAAAQAAADVASAQVPASISSIERKAAQAASQVAARIKLPIIKSIRVPQSFRAPSPFAIAEPKPTVTVQPATINAPAPKGDLQPQQIIQSIGGGGGVGGGVDLGGDLVQSIGGGGGQGGDVGATGENEAQKKEKSE